jgi:hypothetical protein
VHNLLLETMGVVDVINGVKEFMKENRFHARTRS